MILAHELTNILDNALAGNTPNRAQCEYLLEFPAESLESNILCSVADNVSRQRFGNQAVILGQIGIDIAPCSGGCLFCSFGEEHTIAKELQLSIADIKDRALAFTSSGDLFALFLMTMHDYDFARLISVVEEVRKTIPKSVRIVVNMGDFDFLQAQELKSAGVSGAYHVQRLREGKDTVLDPAQRLRTIESIKAAGLQWYYCCEPVGPEHSNKELVDQMFIGVDMGCFQHAAMRRVYIPGSPLARFGQITELRLAQVTAVVALASIASSETQSIAVHEPNLLGLRAGANSIYAETGANPRDMETDTARGRGLDIIGCRTMLYEAGFGHILRGDETRMELGYC